MTAGGPQVVNLRSLLEEMIEKDASDLHIVAGERPKVRVDGDIVNSSVEHVLTPKDTLSIAYSVLTENQKKRFETENELDFSFGIQNLARFRGNCFKQRGCVSLVIRQIPFNVRTFEDLGLPSVVAKLAEKPRGLVLVTGPTGSGKSTTLAAMIDKINKELKGHIITVEDPIEFIHRHQACIVNQREIGTDTNSFAAALKYALRQDPDVVLIGEMRDLETIAAALTIAETGHLAFATLHTNSAMESINRIIDVFPSHQQSQIRAQLAFVLEGVITQTLLQKAKGRGRVMAAEIMICTPAIRALIRDNKVHQIESSMQAGKKYGMQTLNDALYQLYMGREVTKDECLRVTRKPNEFLRAICGPPRDVVIFTRQFATMINSGLPLLQALDIQSQQTENKVLADITRAVVYDVESGHTHADALRKHPKAFSDLYVNMVAAGEAGGILDTILIRLAEFLEKNDAIVRKVKGAMIYPGVILSVAVIAISVLLIFVIPTFQNMFASVNLQLPLPTRIVIGASHTLTQYWWLILGAIGAGVFGLNRYYQTAPGRLQIDTMLLKTPVLGDVLRKAAVSRFTRTLGTLISSGVSILDGLEITARTAGNMVIHNAVMQSRASIAGGETIAAPLAKSKVFPPMVISMISVGEQTGGMDEMLSKIADFYDDEVDAAVSALLSLMEPIMIGVLCVIVGGTGIAMCLPIFDMVNAVQERRR